MEAEISPLPLHQRISLIIPLSHLPHHLLKEVTAIFKSLLPLLDYFLAVEQPIQATESHCEGDESEEGERAFGLVAVEAVFIPAFELTVRFSPLLFDLRLFPANSGFEPLRLDSLENNGAVCLHLVPILDLLAVVDDREAPLFDRDFADDFL